MSTDNGSSASAAKALNGHAVRSAGVHHRRVDDACATAPLFSEHHQRLTAGGASPANPVLRSPDEALPLTGFLEDLHRERRRAERSRVPLSLVLYQVDDNKTPDSRHADRLLEVLHCAKRETDILGYLSDDTIAVLCPDTNEQGTKGFMRKIDAQADDLPFTAMAATYPDDLFENLVKGTHPRPALQPFLISGEMPGEHRGYPLKRCLDIAGALLALCIFGPLMLIVAATVALTSHGPVFFKQTRLGKGGVPFTFYKFRSMVANGDERIHREFVTGLINAQKPASISAAARPALYKLRSDPRVTRVGRFLRTTSMDELPQFFNVLKGDMSLVGPRPPIPYEAEQYQSWHLRRVLTVKPGITGLWQVEGRSKVTFNEMVRMDLKYIRECSFGLDIKILLKTIVVVIGCEGAG